MPTKESKLTLTTREGRMDVLAFVPELEPGKRAPAIIVLQEAFGVNAHIKNVCRRLAAAGYAAFAPELFHRAGAGLEFGYEDWEKVKPMMGQLTNMRIGEDLRVTYMHLRTLAYVDPGRIVPWGFCMGGWAAVLAACEFPVAASIAFYPGGLVHLRPGIGFTPLLDRFNALRSPMLMVFGGQDASIPPADVKAIKDKLGSLGKTFEVEVYPNGGHGFFCEDRSAYHKESAEAAWLRATTWLKEQLS